MLSGISYALNVRDIVPLFATYNDCWENRNILPFPEVNKMIGKVMLCLNMKQSYKADLPI